MLPASSTKQPLRQREAIHRDCQQSRASSVHASGTAQGIRGPARGDPSAVRLCRQQEAIHRVWCRAGRQAFTHLGQRKASGNVRQTTLRGHPTRPHLGTPPRPGSTMRSASETDAAPMAKEHGARRRNGCSKRNFALEAVSNEMQKNVCRSPKFL